MSKSKRRQQKQKIERRATARENDGLTGKASVVADIAENDFKDSVVRDTTVIAQMLNDYPHTPHVNRYHAASMGVMVIDLPKDYLSKVLRASLKHAGVDQEEAHEIADEVLQLRLLTVRFKD